MSRLLFDAFCTSTPGLGGMGECDHTTLPRTRVLSPAEVPAPPALTGTATSAGLNTRSKYQQACQPERDRRHQFERCWRPEDDAQGEAAGNTHPSPGRQSPFCLADPCRPQPAPGPRGRRPSTSLRSGPAGRGPFLAMCRITCCDTTGTHRGCPRAATSCPDSHRRRWQCPVFRPGRQNLLPQPSSRALRDR